MQHRQRAARHAAAHQLQHRLAPVVAAAQEPPALRLRRPVLRLRHVARLSLCQPLVRRRVRRIQQHEHAARGGLPHAPGAADHLLVLRARVALLAAANSVKYHHRHVQVHACG